MLGAIAGDVIGSVYEGRPLKTKDFPLYAPNSHFTDDTAMTVATAYAILHDGDYGGAYKLFGRRYPNAGYGGTFYRWIHSDSTQPYNSWGNGSAMRVSPIGFAFDTEDEVLAEARKSAEVTHNHPEGIKGAQATALTIFLARTGHEKTAIREIIAQRFDYDLNRRIDDIRPAYAFDVSCQGSVPESILAFLDANDVEDAIRNAVSLGGDSDTMACIAGAAAEAFYGPLPSSLIEPLTYRLPEEFWDIIDQFTERHRH